MLQRQILQLQIEKTALEKEKDALSKDRLQKISAELDTKQTNFNTMMEKWKKENI